MQQPGMLPFGSCEQDGLRCSRTSRFLSRFPERLSIGAIAQPESLPAERLKVFFYRRDAGYHSLMVRLPDEGLVFVVLGNSRMTALVEDLRKQLSKLCLSQPYEAW